MTRAVRELQAILDLPLQIDTADTATLEAAMRLYNGKPLVNSVSGKQASMDAVFPLVRRYGGVVVALTLDEDGIPPTAEGRLAVARKIVETAASYGIDKKDILVDVLTMAGQCGSERGQCDARCAPPGAGGARRPHSPGGVERLVRFAPAGDRQRVLLHARPAKRAGCRDPQSLFPRYEKGVSRLSDAHRTGQAVCGIHRGGRPDTPAELAAAAARADGPGTS